jgi:hypothetical protein
MPLSLRSPGAKATCARFALAGRFSNLWWVGHWKRQLRCCRASGAAEPRYSAWRLSATSPECGLSCMVRLRRVWRGRANLSVHLRPASSQPEHGAKPPSLCQSVSRASLGKPTKEEGVRSNPAKRPTAVASLRSSRSSWWSKSRCIGRISLPSEQLDTSARASPQCEQGNGGVGRVWVHAGLKAVVWIGIVAMAGCTGVASRARKRGAWAVAFRLSSHRHARNLPVASVNSWPYGETQ